MHIKDLVPWGNNKGSDIANPEDNNPVFSLRRDVNRIFDDFWRRFRPTFRRTGTF